MGAEKKYTPTTLKKAVDRYFKSITRKVPLTEQVPTDQKDKDGHVIYKTVPLTNQLGEQIVLEQYVVPPSVGDLAIFLGIHRSTWTDYCDEKKHPEFSDTTTYARGRMHAYLERESLTRQGKDLKGVLFNLENNYGYREKTDIVVSGSVEDLLKGLEDAGGEVQQF